jgi:hypothetical protein
MEHFYDQYAVTYHYDSRDQATLSKVNSLQATYANIMSSWDSIEKHSHFPSSDLREAYMHLNSHHFFDEKKIWWLFWDVCMIDTRNGFLERAQTMIIDYNDLSLTLNDYALMLYASYQPEDTQNVMATFPSVMLETIFEPIAKENMFSWCDAWLQGYENSYQNMKYPLSRVMEIRHS